MGWRVAPLKSYMSFEFLQVMKKKDEKRKKKMDGERIEIIFVVIKKIREYVINNFTFLTAAVNLLAPFPFPSLLSYWLIFRIRKR